MQVKIKIDINNSAHVKGLNDFLDIIRGVATPTEIEVVKEAPKVVTRARTAPMKIAPKVEPAAKVAIPGDLPKFTEMEVKGAVEVVSQPAVVVEERPIADEPVFVPGAVREPAPVEMQPVVQAVAETAVVPAPVAVATVTLNQIKDLQTKLVGTHREAIKGMLTQLGAANASTLAEENYVEYYEFLKTL